MMCHTFLLRECESGGELGQIVTSNRMALKMVVDGGKLNRAVHWVRDARGWRMGGCRCCKGCECGRYWPGGSALSLQGFILVKMCLRSFEGANVPSCANAPCPRIQYECRQGRQACSFCDDRRWPWGRQDPWNSCQMPDHHQGSAHVLCVEVILKKKSFLSWWFKPMNSGTYLWETKVIMLPMAQKLCKRIAQPYDKDYSI